MRPVIRGDSPAYQTASENNVNIRFQNQGNGTNATLVSGQLESQLIGGITEVQLQTLKNYWETHRVGGNAVVTRVRQLITDKVAGIYKQAAGPLTHNMGPYCSYCESPVSGLLEVEHLAPKSEFPLLSTTWDNFLLSCSPCNATKGNRPRLQDLQPNQNLDNFLLANYVLPTDPNVPNGVYVSIIPVLHYLNDQNQFIPLANPIAMDLNNEIVTTNVSTQTVSANITMPNQPNLNGVIVRVFLEAQNVDNRQAAAQETINLCGLNNMLHPNAAQRKNTTWDRRVFNRTIAWFTILKQLNNLLAAEIIQPHQQAEPMHIDAEMNLFTVMWNNFLLSAKAYGFYSLWYYILQNTFYVDPDNNPLINQFRPQNGDPNNPENTIYFPGTNYALLPH